MKDSLDMLLGSEDRDEDEEEREAEKEIARCVLKANQPPSPPSKKLKK